MPARTPLFSLLLAAASALVASVALAQDTAPILYEAPTCEAPISTCRMGPLPLETERPSLAPSILRDDCPLGYACVCVPSSPDTADCDAQVCVRDERRECDTACDCGGGLGCFDGQCLPGIVPVYCCDDANACPAGGFCEHREGGMDTCPRGGEDATCRERWEKASQAVAKVVKRSNSCREASDCVLIDTSTACGGTCGALVNEKRARRASRIIDRIDDKVCQGFGDHCPVAIPGCLVQFPACVEGQCVGIYAPPPPIPLPFPVPMPVGHPDGTLLELQPTR